MDLTAPTRAERRPGWRDHISPPCLGSRSRRRDRSREKRGCLCTGEFDLSGRQVWKNTKARAWPGWRSAPECGA